MIKLFGKKDAEQRLKDKETKRLTKMIDKWSNEINAPYFDAETVSKTLIEKGWRQCGKNDTVKRTPTDEKDPLYLAIRSVEEMENFAVFLVIDMADMLKRNQYRLMYK